MQPLFSKSLSFFSIESFLIGLNEKGVSETEVTAAAIVMKEKSLKFDIGDGSHIDTCGTGGTGLHTFNCSTASSFVAAAAGAKITKHGNKAISSKSGSADFLVQSGANINHEREKLISIFDNSFLNEIASLKKTFRFEDGTIIEIEEIQRDSPLMIFYPSGENSGGVIDIYHTDYIQRIAIKNNGKVTNEVISY